MDGNNSFKLVDIELLALDLKDCRRCVGTQENLFEAITSVAGTFHELDTIVRVTRHVVSTVEQAQRLGFAASPTIRVNGRDIAKELKLSRCEDCSAGCGCGVAVDCRVWVWQETDYLEAPIPMILDALLRTYASGTKASVAATFEIPDHLRRHFASLAQKAASVSAIASDDCCDRTVCCEPSAKSECCGGDVSSVGGH